MQRGSKDERQLIHTRTGEEFQPVRIYMQVFNLKTVLGVFKKLRCMEYSHQFNCWRWLHDHETKKLQFRISYNKIPKEFRPLVLADIYIREDQIVMDLRSFQRALHAVEFFYKRINSHAARITHVRVVNRLFDAQVEDEAKLQPPFDHFFEQKDVYIPDMEELDRKLSEVTQQYTDLEERSEALMAYLEEQSKKTLPLIEQVPVNVYEDKTAAGLSMALMFRNMEAIQHWVGNTSFTQYDAIQLYSESLGDIEDE